MPGVDNRAARSRRPAEAAVWFLCAGAATIFISCTPPIKSTLPGSPSAAQIAELWIRPEPGRDLFYGVGGKKLAPDPAVRYTILEIKRSGYSRGDRKSTRLNSSHTVLSRMPSSA